MSYGFLFIALSLLSLNSPLFASSYSSFCRKSKEDIQQQLKQCFLNRSFPNHLPQFASILHYFFSYLHHPIQPFPHKKAIGDGCAEKELLGHRYLSILSIEEIFGKKKPLHHFIALHGLSDGDGVVVGIGDVRVNGHAIARFQKFLSKDLLFIEKEYAIVQPTE